MAEMALGNGPATVPVDRRPAALPVAEPVGIESGRGLTQDSILRGGLAAAAPAAGSRMLSQERVAARDPHPSSGRTTTPSPAKTIPVPDVGPSTVRADVPTEELRGRLEERELRCAIVTTPAGVLLGVVRRVDL